MKRIALVLSASLVLLTVAAAQQSGSQDALPKGFETKPVLKTTMTASHGKIEYPGGQAEVVSVTGELKPGGQTARHQHPVPVFVYVLEGTLVVQADGGQPREYKTGQGFVEDVSHWHQAFNKTDKPARILVVFMGEQGKPTTINAQ